MSGGGGEPEALTQLDPEQNEANHTWPFIIPGREAVVFVIGTANVPERRQDLIVVSLDGDRATKTLLSTEFSERNAALSPDGAWMAYQSDGSGRYEVYVRPFPDVEAGLWQVSTAGGVDPVWAPDGSELFFRQGNQLLAARVEADPSFTRGTPEVLFDVPYYWLYPSFPKGVST